MKKRSSQWNLNLGFESLADAGPDFFYSQKPQLFSNPQWGAANLVLAQQMGFDDVEWLKNEALMVASGHSLNANQGPALAQKYAGHQFGQYNPALGDGRGLWMGEHHFGQNKFDLHLKGAGQTPFSRMGDGNAVLRSSIREFLGGEALTGLSIPSSRALWLVWSDEVAFREVPEKKAQILRVAQTHLRFGHFEFYKWSGQSEKLKALLDFSMNSLAPHLESKNYADFFKEICAKTAQMVALWQVYGFCHGVMNSDNMSLASETFDFGPYAFLDDFQAGYICNHSDDGGRYSYENQPDIALWNLQCLARTLTDFIEIESIKGSLQNFVDVYKQEWRDGFSKRLGFFEKGSLSLSELSELLEILDDNQVDMTLFFRGLSQIQSSGLNGQAPLLELFSNPFVGERWIKTYQDKIAFEESLGHTEILRKTKLNQCNPLYTLRNCHLQKAIEMAEQGDFSEVERLLKVAQNPFEERSEWADLAHRPPSEKRRLILSCSS